MANVKHGGCANCGSKEQEFLKSISTVSQPIGQALCDKCISIMKGVSR